MVDDKIFLLTTVKQNSGMIYIILSRSAGVLQTDNEQLP